MDEIFPVVESAIRAAGGLLADRQPTMNVREKGPADLVTDIDVAAQTLLETMLSVRFPDIPFLAEEGRDHDQPIPALGQGPCWVIDPLDGTTNFVHGLPAYCVSIALCRGGEAVLGVIFDPVRDELFHAAKGSGAYLNGERLRTSGCLRLDQSLLAFSLPARVAPESPEITRFLRVLPRCRALRRWGSSALNLAYVAAGRLDGYWASSTKIWDIAAGTLLVAEAGGTVSSLSGERLVLDRPSFVAASSESLHRQLLEAIGPMD